LIVCMRIMPFLNNIIFNLVYLPLYNDPDIDFLESL
jgi:hypothetical protein